MSVCIAQWGGLAITVMKGLTSVCGQKIWIFPRMAGRLFKLQGKDVLQSKERDDERKRVMDMLGVKGATAGSPVGSPEMAVLRVALLKTKPNLAGKQVYERSILYCVCHVHPEDVIRETQPNSFACKEGFRFISRADQNVIVCYDLYVRAVDEHEHPRMKHAN